MSTTTKTPPKDAARALHHHTLTCLQKLSDKDTHASAFSELQTISKNLTTTTLPSYLASISTLHSSTSPSTRRTCLHLVSHLTTHHANSLTPYVSKLISSILRLLRDPDSSVRAACVSASLSISTNVSEFVPFVSVFKPFLEVLFVEQDLNGQNSVALCLVSVIEGFNNDKNNKKGPDVGFLRRVLVRLEKLVKCESFKAKGSVLLLIKSVVGVKGVILNSGGSGNAVSIRDLVMCCVGFLSFEDWGARKAAAEVLIRIVEMEKCGLDQEFKDSCLKAFEARRFDKVKAVRETMNLMIQAWKEIPDQVDQVSPPLIESQGSSIEKASDGRCPQVKKSSPPKTPPCTDVTLSSTARRRTSLGGNNGIKTGSAMFRKLDRRKPSNSKVEPTRSSVTVVLENHLDEDEMVSETGEVEDMRRFGKPGIRRALFNDKKKPDGLKSGSRVGLCEEEASVVSNETGDIHKSQRDCEDLSLIRQQLVQIKNQQSDLLNVLQSFIESSQNGMHSLEARVHGLELAIDEISFDLAVSTGRRTSQNDAACCKLPGSDFWSSKLWRKAEARSSTSRLPTSSGPPTVAAVLGMTHENGDAQGFPLRNRRLIMNPLAEMPRSS